MRHLTRLALPTLLAAVAALAAYPALGQAPARPPQQGAPAQPPPPAPAKPYKTVAITLPAPMNDAGFEAFRKQLGDIANRKDRAALARLVVARDFFWATESGEKAVKTKSGIDNLVAAIKLNAKDNSGWFMLAGFSLDPTAAPMPDRKDVVCAPVEPGFDEKALEEIAKATGTDPGEWGYPSAAGLEVRSGPQANAPVIEKLGLHFVRVMPEDGPPPAPPQNANQPPPLRIVTPAGKVGFVPIDAIAPLGNDQMCYVKDASGWKIAGFIGGEP
jgi:hypothetical protein